MKKAMNLFLSIILLLSLVGAEGTAGALSPVETTTHLRRDREQTFLYQREDGGLTRVEYLTGSPGKIVVEDYDEQFTLTAQRVIEAELPLWGGFFSGANYNYLINGANNLAESKEAEVVRVVQYDKDRNRLGDTRYCGQNTQKPFSFGSLRCAEGGDILYIHTCRTMFKSNDGLNHQANLSLALRQSDRSIVPYANGYVSHSLDQYALVDAEGRPVFLDLGDGYPRGVALTRDGYVIAARRFPGEIGDNETGARLGGLAETREGYIAAFADTGTGALGSLWAIYLSFTPKDDFSAAASTITQVSKPGDANRPRLVSTGPDGSYVFWNGADHTLRYATYDAYGCVSEIKSLEGVSMDDCQPIVCGDDIVWYATGREDKAQIYPTVPSFYFLNASGVRVHTANEALPSAEPVSRLAYASTQPVGQFPARGGLRVPALRRSGRRLYLLQATGDRQIYELQRGLER